MSQRFSILGFPTAGAQAQRWRLNSISRGAKRCYGAPCNSSLSAQQDVGMRYQDMQDTPTDRPSRGKGAALVAFMASRSLLDGGVTPANYHAPSSAFWANHSETWAHRRPGMPEMALAAHQALIPHFEPFD
jgi:hypothetical protein